MTERLVVCFRSPELVIEPRAYLSAAHTVVERALGMGGRLIAWGATVHAFSFDPDALAAGIELCLAVLREATPGKEHGVGISAGSLEDAKEPGANVTLTWGYPLVCSTALARAARPGEILVDPTVGAAKRGELLTVGSRVGVYGTLRMRGLLLDVKHPWRTSLAATGGVARPALVGDLLDVEAPPGTITFVRAGRGFGGSRMLERIEQALEPARVLHVTPHPFGEPLGALRRAMLRAVTMGHAPLNLSGEAGHSLDALLAGEGLDPDSSADLLVAWLTPDSVHDPRGALILDDAAEIDADTLETVERAAAVAADAFRVVARLGEAEPVPLPLTGLRVAHTTQVVRLSHEDAMQLAGACTGRELSMEIRESWATRGGHVPLAVVESVREAVEAGELVWEDGAAIVRQRSSGTSGARPPKYWVRKRLSHQPDDARRVLEALAILGGQAESRDLADVIARRADLKLDTEASVAVLIAAGWVQRLKPDVIALAGATHRDAILATLEERDFQMFHRAAGEMFARRERPLSAAIATVHLVLASDPVRATEVGKLAAGAARAMGLERTADAFDDFAERGNLGPLSTRNLFTPQLEAARATPSVWPAALRSSVPPPGLEVDDGGEDEEPPPSGVAPTDGIPRARASEPPSAAVAALRTGDLEAVDRMAVQLRVDEGRTALAERLQAMAHIARGETGDAIRRLREAAEQARKSGSRDRCRANLALGVALAAASRHEEALLETLDALARAREMADAKGERACVTFLGQLAATVGHHDAAEAWASLVAT